MIHILYKMNGLLISLPNDFEMKIYTIKYGIKIYKIQTTIGLIK